MRLCRTPDWRGAAAALAMMVGVAGPAAAQMTASEAARDAGADATPPGYAAMERVGRTSLAAGEYQINAGAAYQSHFDSFSFEAAAGFGGGAFREPGGAFLDGAAVEPEVGFSARSQIDRGGFSVMGGYDSVGGGSFLDSDAVRDRLSIGGGYTAGSWSFALSYGVEDVAREESDDVYDRRRLSLGGGYAVGDRLSAGWALEWGDADCAEGGAGECQRDNSFGGGFLLGITF